jgi:hypothetical protein
MKHNKHIQVFFGFRSFERTSTDMDFTDVIYVTTIKQHMLIDINN